MMMKHSILTKLTGQSQQKPQRRRKKVHWYKRLEEIQNFEPQLVNIKQHKTLFLRTSETASSLEKQNQSASDLQTVTRIQNTSYVSITCPTTKILHWNRPEVFV